MWLRPVSGFVVTTRKHRVVCHRETDTVGGIIYTHRDSDGPVVEVALTRDLWDSLGRPNRVTATIRPGNHLTGDDT